MDFISDADLLSKLLATLLTLLTAVFAFFRWVRPRLKQAASDIQAGRDALIGRDAIHDTITGRELVPALPGIGVTRAESTAAWRAVEAIATQPEHDDTPAPGLGEN
jgi:hypothetical protein